MRGLEDSVLVQGAGGLWQEATTAKFLDAISDGTLPKEAFNRWLVQDYHFADGLTVFQALAVAKAPRQFRRPLVAGLTIQLRDWDRFLALRWFASTPGKRTWNGLKPKPPCGAWPSIHSSSAS